MACQRLTSFALLCMLAPMLVAASQVPLKLALSPSKAVAGKPFDLKVTFANPANGKLIPASQFRTIHERLLHLVAVGADLDTFIHVHPEDLGQTITPKSTYFSLKKLTFPKAGKYNLAFDGLLDGGEVAEKSVITISGTPAMTTKPYSSRVGVLTHNFTAVLNKQPVPPVSLTGLIAAAANTTANVYQISLSGPTGKKCIPGQEATYTWTISKGGAPVKDLTPLLGADMHVAAIIEGGQFFLHAHGMAGDGAAMNMDMSGHDHAGMDMGGHDDHGDHGMASSSDDDHAHHASSGPFGPSVHASLTLPTAGRYLLLGQLSRGSDLILAPFWIKCSGEPVPVASPTKAATSSPTKAATSSPTKAATSSPTKTTTPTPTKADPHAHHHGRKLL